MTLNDRWVGAPMQSIIVRKRFQNRNYFLLITFLKLLITFLKKT